MSHLEHRKVNSGAALIRPALAKPWPRIRESLWRTEVLFCSVFWGFTDYGGASRSLLGQDQYLLPWLCCSSLTSNVFSKGCFLVYFPQGLNCHFPGVCGSFLAQLLLWQNIGHKYVVYQGSTRPRFSLKGENSWKSGAQLFWSPFPHRPSGAAWVIPGLIIEMSDSLTPLGWKDDGVEAVTSAAICLGLMEMYCGNWGNSLSSSPAQGRRTSGLAVPASFATSQWLASPAGSFPPAPQALCGQQNICFLPSFWFLVCLVFLFFTLHFFPPMLKTQENQDPHRVLLNQRSKHTDVCPALMFRSVGAQVVPHFSSGVAELDELCSVIVPSLSPGTSLTWGQNYTGHTLSFLGEHLARWAKRKEQELNSTEDSSVSFLQKSWPY